jgi:hypothetical protein
MHIYIIVFIILNALLLGSIILFVVLSGRQQRKLHQLSDHLDDLVRELHSASPPAAGQRAGAAKNENNDAQKMEPRK